MRVTFLVQKIGPYHHARLAAYAALRAAELSVIEFRCHDTVYAWAPVAWNEAYKRTQTHTDEALRRALEENGPDVVVCVGYADREISCAVSWALTRRIPLVTCSDSTYDDEPRSPLKELLKQQVLSSFDAALVAGRRAHAYLTGLGMDEESLFFPWDVVDNDYFRTKADQCRANAWTVRRQFNLPEKYFLCVARFVAKKNLDRLIAAYGEYVRQARGQKGVLVLSGAGPLEFALRARVRQEGLDTYVHFPGFIQYEDLPAYYALSRAFILPSLSDQWGLVVNEAMAAGLPVLVSDRCGCAPDLVHEGRNGFCFDPHQSGAMARGLLFMSDLDERQREIMGMQSREIVAAYAPEKFASGLSAAIEFAVSRPRSRARWLPRIVAQSLALRSAAS